MGLKKSWIIFYSGMQNRCGGIFSLLASASCPDQCTSTTASHPSLSMSLSLLPRQKKLHVSHALSMDVILSRGLELGSHASDCWKHVFRYRNKFNKMKNNKLFVQLLRGKTGHKLNLMKLVLLMTPWYEYLYLVYRSMASWTKWAV